MNTWSASTRRGGPGRLLLLLPLLLVFAFASAAFAAVPPAANPPTGRIAFGCYAGPAVSDSRDLFSWDAVTGTVRQVMRTPYYDEFVASWSPDGRRIAYVARKVDGPPYAVAVAVM